MKQDPEAQVDQWMETFERLPESRKKNLKKWFAAQKLIIDNAGLSAGEWFGYVQWALENPGDFGFIDDFKAAHASESRRLLGTAQRPATPSPAAPRLLERERGAATGLERELFDRFMKGRLGAMPRQA